MVELEQSGTFYHRVLQYWLISSLVGARIIAKELTGDTRKTVKYLFLLGARLGRLNLQLKSRAGGLIYLI